MELTRVENQQTQLLQFILLLLLILSGVVTYTAVVWEHGRLIPSLTVISLIACLYALGKERRLRGTHQRLVKDLVQEQARSKSLDDRLHEMAGLYRALTIVNSAVEPQGAFDAVLRAALDLVEGNRGSIMVLDETGRHLRIASSRGLSEQVVEKTRQPVGTGVAGWVAEHCEPVLLEGSPEVNGRFRDLVNHDEDVLFAISAPLHLRDRVMGVINVGVTGESTKESFGDYDMRMLTLFAHHASVAIENARLRLMEITPVYRR